MALERKELVELIDRVRSMQGYAPEIGRIVHEFEEHLKKYDSLVDLLCEVSSHLLKKGVPK